MREDNGIDTLGTLLQRGLGGTYVKFGIAVAVGVAVILSVYFLVLKKDTTMANPANQGLRSPQAQCACPNCGKVIPKPKGMDCEEVNCPHCGHALIQAVTFAAAPGNRQAGTVPLTQNQRETLAEQGIAVGGRRGRLNQNQRETLAEQGIAANGGGRARLNQNQRGTLAQRPARRAVAHWVVNPHRTCVCPNCGEKIAGIKGVDCSQVHCPFCGTNMTNAIYVGQTPKGTQPAAMVTGRPPCPNGGGTHQGGFTAAAAPCPSRTGGAPPCQAGGGGGTCPTAGGTNRSGLTAAAAPCPNRMGGPPPCQGGVTGTTGVGGMPGTTPITYTNTVSGIISRNCLRCHGGQIRNLSTYNHVKAYADSGLLKMMIEPGGPMSRFLTAHESHQIVSWIRAGAPQ